jgi:hypothetical protein
LLGETVAVGQVYRGATDERRLYLLTDSLPEAAYRIDRFASVVDTAGNTAVQDAPPFSVAAAADTFRLRFLKFIPTPVAGQEPVALSVRESPGFQLNQYVSEDELASLVVATDTAGVPRSSSAATEDGVTWRLTFDPPLEPGETVRLAAAADIVPSDTVMTMDYRRLGVDETGSFTGYVETEHDAIVEVYSEEGRSLKLMASVGTQGDYRFDDLAAGNYRLRLFSDVDGDGEWDWGRIEPYESPEPMAWYSDSARVRVGWETALDTVRVGGPTE